MKIHINLVLLMAISMLLSCASGRSFTGRGDSGNKSSLDNYDNNKMGTNLTLADMLRNIGSIRVLGTHPNVKVQIRGNNSLKLDNEPIFVVNGVNIGSNYYRASNLIDPNNVKSIRVLNSLHETNIWGEAGANGVIVIKTITDKEEQK